MDFRNTWTRAFRTIRLPQNIKTLGIDYQKPNYDEDVFSEKKFCQKVFEKNIFAKEQRALSQNTPKIGEEKFLSLFSKTIQEGVKRNPSLNSDIYPSQEKIY